MRPKKPEREQKILMFHDHNYEDMSNKPQLGRFTPNIKNPESITHHQSHSHVHKNPETGDVVNVNNDVGDVKLIV